MKELCQEKEYDLLKHYVSDKQISMNVLKKL